MDQGRRVGGKKGEWQRRARGPVTRGDGGLANEPRWGEGTRCFPSLPLLWRRRLCVTLLSTHDLVTSFSAASSSSLSLVTRIGTRAS